MAKKPAEQLPDIIAHWHHLFESFHASTEDVYKRLEAVIAARKMPDTHIRRISVKEGGMLSANRTYLRVSRYELNFDICAAPFGTAFFMSSWCGKQPTGCLIPGIPFLSSFLAAAAYSSTTYFHVDTALLFQESIHAAVLQVIDELTNVEGVRKLNESERKPVMREFFSIGA